MAIHVDISKRELGGANRECDMLAFLNTNLINNEVGGGCHKIFLGYGGYTPIAQCVGGEDLVPNNPRLCPIAGFLKLPNPTLFEPRLLKEHD